MKGADARARWAALADPKREAIVRLLMDGRRSVGEIARQLPVSGPAVSKHLRLLQSAGLVHQRSDATCNFYALEPAALGELREGIVSFFAPDARVEPHVGGAFRIHFDLGAPPGGKGADGRRFMALQPRQMLSFDWNAPPSMPQVRE